MVEIKELMKHQQFQQASRKMKELVDRYHIGTPFYTITEQALKQVFMAQKTSRTGLVRKYERKIAKDEYDDYIADVQYVDSKEIYAKTKQLKLKNRYKLQTNEKIMLIANNYTLTVDYHQWKELYQIAGGTLNFDTLIRSQKAIADFGEEIKTAGPDNENDTEWTMISGMDKLYGKNVTTGLKASKIITQVREWVNNEFQMTYNGSTDKWHEKMEEHLLTFLKYKNSTINTDETRERFLQNIVAQSTQGSGYDPDSPEIQINVTNKQIGKLKYKKSKFTKACALTIDQKRKKMMSPKPSYARVSIKYEEFYPKVRTIIASDFKTHLKMTFLRRWLYKWIKGQQSSTLWMNKRQRLHMWKRFSRLDNEVAVPIDQTLYDRHISKADVLKILHILRKLITDVEENSEVVRDQCDNIDILIESLNKGKIIIDPSQMELEKDAGKVILDYNSGLLSGWALTAELNTLHNITQHLIAIDYANNNIMPVQTTLFNAQGDDQLMRTKNWAQAVSYYIGMSVSGAEINLHKNFFSDKHDEYLRRVGYNGNINGYLPRLIWSLMWNPTLVRQTNEQKMSESTTIWKKICERMTQPYKKIIGYIKKDCIAAKVPIDDINNFLALPKVLGGPGFVNEDGNYRINLTTNENVAIGIDIEANGLQEFNLRYGENQDREIKEWTIKSIALQPIQHGVRIYDDTQTYTQDIKLKAKPFTILSDIKITKPQMNDGWKQEYVFSSRDIVMKQAYKNITAWRERFRCSKKWLYDYLLDRKTAAAPTVANMSDEFSALVAKRYTGSLYLAMMKKKERSSNDWHNLNLFYERELGKILSVDYNTYSWRG